MKKTVVTIICLLALSINGSAQEGHSIGVDYKIGITRFSHAYTSHSMASTVPQQSDFEFYSDAFIQNNLAFNYVYYSENVYLKSNIEGLFYWIFYEYSLHNFLKSKYWNYNNVQSDNTFIAEVDKGESATVNHPINGGSDYQFIDWDVAFGNEKIKVGANFGVGLLGSRMDNGHRLTNYSSHPEVTNINLGYYSIGPKVFISNYNNLPITASVGINRLIGFNGGGSNSPTNGEKRKGFGIDIDAKYYIGENSFMPYLAAYVELKKFSKSVDPFPYASGGHGGTSFKDIDVPGLNTISFGIKFGFLITDW